jgi:hypothetical protein
MIRERKELWNKERKRGKEEGKREWDRRKKGGKVKINCNY